MCLPLNAGVIWQQSTLTDVVIGETGAAGANLLLKYKGTMTASLGLKPQF